MAPPPTPFEVVTGPDGLRVGSNGATRVMLLDADGRLFRRRGIRGLALKPPADVLVPQLNAFAGELLASPDITPQAAVARLLAIAGTVPTAEPERSEWCVAELDGVRVYVSGADVVVTRQDLQP